MTYSDELLGALSSLSPKNWEGVVYRHMFGATSPEKENLDGARWNPEDVAAIYASVDRETALAEGDYQIECQPYRPIAERRIHRIRVRLASVLDLSNWDLLRALDIDVRRYSSPGLLRCKEIGGAISHLGHDGLVAPSARASGMNLVIYPTNRDAAYEFTPIDFVVVP